MIFPSMVSDELGRAVQIAGTVLCATSIALTALVLGLALWIYCVKEARPHIRRVSFRLMMMAMCSGLLYDMARMCLYADILASSIWCQVGVTVFFQALTSVNFLVTCIALNLMLITCFDVNPIRRGLEKWYIGGSFALGIVLPIIPAAQGHFGPDPLYGLCYLSIEDSVERFRVVMVEFVLWQILTCLIATISVGATIVTLIRQSRATKRVLRAGQANVGVNLGATLSEMDLGPGTPGSLAPLTSTEQGAAAAGKSPSPGSRSGPQAWRARACRRVRGLTGGGTRGFEHGQLQEKVYGIAMRISLYPISLIAVNTTTSVADIYFNYTGRDDVVTEGETALFVIYHLLYAGRGIVFALLCLLFDPCLKRGVAAAWASRYSVRSKSSNKSGAGLLPTALAIPPHHPHPKAKYSPDPDADPHAFHPSTAKDLWDEDDRDKSGPRSNSKSQLSLNAFMNASLARGPYSYAAPETRRPTDSSLELDITAALNRLPYYPPAHLPNPSHSPSHSYSMKAQSGRGGQGESETHIEVRPTYKARRWGKARAYDGAAGNGGGDGESGTRRPPNAYTRSFVGVASDSLPSGLTDDVDVDLRLTYVPSRHSGGADGGGTDPAASANAAAGSSSLFAPHGTYQRYTPPPRTPEEELVDPLDGGDGIMLQPMEPVIYTPRASLTPVPVDANLASSAGSGSGLGFGASPGSLRRRSQHAEVLADSIRPLAAPLASAPGERAENPRHAALREGGEAGMEEPPRKMSWGSIPTAPTPQRILQRRARMAAALARRQREEEELELRRLSELTDQL